MALSRLKLQALHRPQLLSRLAISWMAPKRRTKAVAAEPEPQHDDKPGAKRARKSKDAAAATAAVAAAEAGAAAAAAGAGPDGGPSYWLVKSEPDVFSIDDLAAKPDQTEHWDGVRSHQAKKVLQSMQVGDQAFFYHSNAKPPGIVGIVEIVREAYPDHTQFDPKSEYHDPKASRENPTWCMVDCRLVRKLQRQIPLEELKSHSAGPLASMALFKYGRLSVQPVMAAEWQFVLGLEGQAPAGAAEAKAAGGKAKASKAGGAADKTKAGGKKGGGS